MARNNKINRKLKLKAQRESKAQRRQAQAMEQLADQALDIIEFVYGEATEQDEITVRAMVLRGATLEVIMHSLTISAVNQRVPVEDKSRYAFGVMRNLLGEK